MNCCVLMEHGWWLMSEARTWIHARCILNEHRTKRSVFPRWRYSTERTEIIFRGTKFTEIYDRFLFSFSASALSSEMNLRRLQRSADLKLALSWNRFDEFRWGENARVKEALSFSMPLQKRFHSVYDLFRATTCRVTWLSRIFSLPFSRH